jgi:hypothetical protein
MMRLEDRLRHAAAPDAGGAHERARRVVLAAAPPQRRRRRLPLVAGSALVLGLAVTPPGEAVARWVRDLVSGAKPAPLVTHVGHLPRFDGQVLATGPAGAFLVDSDGARRRLGDYASAVWSPHGRFVAVARADTLRAIDPEGAARWTVTTSAPVTAPRWSPDGYRIAYRRDDDLRVVAGDGSGDRPLVDSVTSVPAAWRPGSTHEVAVERAGGALELWSADAGTLIWSRSTSTVRALRWRSAGRLDVVTTEGITTLDGTTGTVIEQHGVRADVTRAAISSARGRVALVYGRRVVVDARERLVADGAIKSLTWSPRGDVLLAATARQWYFIPVRAGSISAAGVTGIDRVVDWCCVTPHGQSRSLPARTAEAPAG